MIHFTCDGCGKEIQHADDHHVVSIQIRPRPDHWTLTEADLEGDQLSKLNAMLDAQSLEALSAPEPIDRRHDLCSACRDRFVSNPFPNPAAVAFNFSKN